MAADEAAGPKLVFNDTTETVFLADMSGDGLSDLVRIRCSEVCYWPNLGYGRFGARVTMNNSPLLDAPELFEPRRIRLADIDGSGATDLIYLAGDDVRLYFNRCGNGFTAPCRLAGFPAVDNLADIDVVDLLGNGTACLVWSSPLPGAAGAPLQYLDLMGGDKPHLLAGMENNLGARTTIEYAASTRFYLEDQFAGRPWVTRLPFPVHVVERTEIFDDISRNRFVGRSAYHDGYFDGVEREFRGFGMVEQWDTEEFAALEQDRQLLPATNLDASSNVPPALMRTWFHTGAFQPAADRGTVPAGLTADEEREAWRSLKGAMLRQELYALDGSAKEPNPYVVTEQAFNVRLVQKMAGNKHAVFFNQIGRAFEFHSERTPADPRVSHGLTLEVDEFGGVFKSASVVYGRQLADPVLAAADEAKQSELQVAYTENTFTNAIDLSDAWRTPALCETATYQLTGLSVPAGSERFAAGVLLSAGGGAGRRQLIAESRTLYRSDDLSGPLARGQLQSLAIVFDTYHVAFSPDLLTQVFGARVDDSMLSTGGYVHRDGDQQWWMPLGRVSYSPGAADDGPTELAYARSHFFLPQRFQDPLGGTVTISWEHDLLPLESRDPLGNTVTAGERSSSGIQSGNDYRVLRPHLLTDPNGNRSAVAFDALGMVVGTAVMGKSGDSPQQGDLLDGFVADLSDEVAAAHLADPLTDPQSILAGAGARLIYDLFAYYRTKSQPQPSPNVFYTLVRETHATDLAAGEKTAVQHRFLYYDGFHREIQRKVQAEPGPDGSPRWAGSGWTIFNNKGNPVRQFEPFFTGTPRFEFDTRIGVSPYLFYDPLQRVVGTLHPDHTWEKAIFDAWRQETWDVNDTALIPDAAADPDAGAFFRRLPATEYLPTWYGQRQAGALGPEEQEAAAKTAVHAATPVVSHADSLGRLFLVIAHNRFQRSGETSPTEEFHTTRVVFDIAGNQRDAIDGKNRVVMRYDYDLLGNRIHQSSMDAGERWKLLNAVGLPVYAWDSRGFRLRTTYDVLHRPVETFLSSGSGPEQMIARLVYGESMPDPEIKNQRGKLLSAKDQTGVAATEEYDFKGNLLTAVRSLTTEYKSIVDWSSDAQLEPETYTTTSRFDALNRPLERIMPDGSRVRHSFNGANLLERGEANLRGEAAVTAFVSNIDYDARGRRERIDYGNGVATTYTFDSLTSRLTGLLTAREPDLPAAQSLAYFYDPAGNITRIRDSAQQTIYFQNARVDPSSANTYDSVYRLIEATGREHLGQNRPAPLPASYDDAPRVHLPHPGDGAAMGAYLEQYAYDEAGNFLAFTHRGSDPANPGWTRSYAYNEPSLLEPGKFSNRLSGTQLSGSQALSEQYAYDAHGNMTGMPHLAAIEWNFANQMSASQRQAVNTGAGQRTYYVCDVNGRRVRKVTESQNGARTNDRAYLGGFEVYREYSGGAVTLQRESLHVMDDNQRVALVETRTQGDDSTGARMVRYQFGNHLGSASLELDEDAKVISYEEYYPYGCTSYQAGRTAAEASLKRYRYTGMERDEETGFACHGMRYYAAWLGRWTSCDPAGIDDGDNLYEYGSCDPITFVDRTGTQTKRQLWLAEQKKFTITPVATRTGRGITKLQRQALKGASRGFGPGPGKGKMDWGHPPDTPHGITPAGGSPPLRPQPAPENRSSQAQKDLKQDARSQGKFARDNKARDTTTKSVKRNQTPPEPFEKPMADYEKASARNVRPTTKPRAATVPEPTGPNPNQLEFNFDQPATASKPVPETPRLSGGPGAVAAVANVAGNAAVGFEFIKDLHEGNPGKGLVKAGATLVIGQVITKVPALV